MSEEDLRLGTLVVGRFRILRRIGGGAMGDVYLASHEGLERQVAVKVLRSSARQASRARFQREAKIAARLSGAHVVRVTDFGELPDGSPFLVMDYVDGPTLASELVARGRLPIAEAVDRVLEVCEALAEAHRAGIVHRDIKPANLLLARQPDGARVLRVADFGVAKADGESTLTGDGASLGSPSYMAPEQIVDPHGVDARADLWAMGVVLYELLTGVRPFDGPSVPATLLAVSQAAPRPLEEVRGDVPAALAEVIAQCLQKAPAQRCASAAELAELLAPFGGEGAAASAARIRRVSAVELGGLTSTLDPDAPLLQAEHQNVTTVTGGVTTPPFEPPAPEVPRVGARVARFALPGFAVLALLAVVLGRAVSEGEVARGALSAVPARDDAQPVPSSRPPTPSASAGPSVDGFMTLAPHKEEMTSLPASSAAPRKRPLSLMPAARPTATASQAQVTEPPKPAPVLATEVDDLGPRK